MEEYILCIKKKKTEALVVPSKEAGPEVIAEGFKYIWSLLEIRKEDKILTKR